MRSWAALVECNRLHDCPFAGTNYDIACAKKHCKSVITRFLLQALRETERSIKFYSDKTPEPNTIFTASFIRNSLASHVKTCRDIKQLLKTDLKNEKLLIKVIEGSS